ncbi:MAG: tetratricopeptide repeat protein [Bryobacteraceae bacterium]
MALVFFLFFAAAAQNAHLSQGIQSLQQGHFQEAIQELTQAVQQEPQSYQGYFNLGLAYAQLGAPDKAELAFRKAVELNGSSAAARYNLGLALLQEGKSSQGIRELDAAVKLAPNNAEIEYNLGTALLESDNAKDALPHLEAAAAGTAQPEAVAQLARAQLACGQPAAALRSLDRLPAEVGRSSQALFLRAQVYAAGQNWAKALDAIEDARKQDTPHAEYLLFEARVYQKLGKPEEALPLLKTAAELDPKSGEIPYSIAFSDYVLDRHDDAERELTRAIRNDPSMDRAYFLLSIDKLTTGDLAAGNAALAKALTLRPKNPFYLCIYGMTLEQDNKKAEAAAIFRQVIALSPAYALPHYHLGTILASNGRNDEAAAQFERAVQIEPEMSEAWYHLAQADKALGKTGEAAKALGHFQSLKRTEQDERQQMIRSMQESLGIRK